nr:immunoglobulin heavy chain junction region [Macaca mulatta]MOW91993.1 immunoglobulin heavy chain junction region [Macaca mulatta]
CARYGEGSNFFDFW